MWGLVPCRSRAVPTFPRIKQENVAVYWIQESKKGTRPKVSMGSQKFNIWSRQLRLVDPVFARLLEYFYYLKFDQWLVFWENKVQVRIQHMCLPYTSYLVWRSWSKLPALLLPNIRFRPDSRWTTCPAKTKSQNELSTSPYPYIETLNKFQINFKLKKKFRFWPDSGRTICPARK